MLFLHEPCGQHPVGASTFVVPAQPPRVIGSVKLASSNARTPFSALEPALKLEEIAFTAYYPADISSTRKPVKGLNWLARPLRETLRGYGRYSGISRFILWPILYLFGSLIKIPVYVNAPLLDPRVAKASKKDDKGGQWPLVIFSHGLGGGRTAYSQICSRLAASGRVVLALEHRDGSGPACIPCVWGPNGKTESKPLCYLRERDIRWPSEDHKAVPFSLRNEQLVFRRHEIYTAYNAFRRFVQDDPEVKIELMDGELLDRQSWSVLDEVSKLPPVRCDSEVGFAGHSFGSCTMLSIMSTSPPSQYSRIPVSQALILDPWLEPLPTLDLVPSTSTRRHNGDDDKLNGDNDSAVRGENIPRLLAINSEVFSVWKVHFDKLQEVMNVWEPAGGRIVTLVGCRHAAFSDFFVLPLIRSAAARRYIKMIGDMSVAFFDDRLEKCLQECPSRKMEILIAGVKKDGKPKKTLVGTLGDIIIT